MAFVPAPQALLWAVFALGGNSPGLLSALHTPPARRLLWGSCDGISGSSLLLRFVFPFLSPPPPLKKWKDCATSNLRVLGTAVLAGRRMRFTVSVPTAPQAPRLPRSGPVACPAASGSSLFLGTLPTLSFGRFPLVFKVLALPLQSACTRELHYGSAGRFCSQENHRVGLCPRAQTLWARKWELASLHP